MSVEPKTGSSSSAKWGSVEWFQVKFQTQDQNSSAAYFGHSSSAYQTMRHSELVALCGEALPFEPTHIVDYGCATGELTARFAAAWPGSRTRGYDFVPGLIDAAKDRHDGIEFAVSGLPVVEPLAANQTLVILSEVLYYLDADARQQCLERLAASAQGELAILFTSVVGPQYFTPDTATELFTNAGFKVEAHVTSLPRYKRLIAAAAGYEGLLAKVASGTAGPRRIEKIAATMWRVPPLRWVLLSLRAGTRAICRSNWLLRMAKRFEDTSANRTKVPSNLVIIGRLHR